MAEYHVGGVSYGLGIYYQLYQRFDQSIRATAMYNSTHRRKSKGETNQSTNPPTNQWGNQRLIASTDKFLIGVYIT